MEEKKLTDEEVLTAIEKCFAIPMKCEDGCPYFNKNGRNFCVENKAFYRDLKRILQEHAEQKAEIETLLCKNAELETRCEGILKDYYAECQTCDEQKTEIERLTEENKQYFAENERLNKSCGLFNIKIQEQIKETYDYVHKADKLKKRNAELQKQVDELKEKIMNLKSAMIDRVAKKSYDSLLTMPEDVEEIFGDAYESEFNKFLQQAVKDTAREILCRIWNIGFEGVDRLSALENGIQEIAKEKGVEVE